MFFLFDWLCAGTSFCQQDCGFGSMFCTNPQSPVPLSHLHGPPGGEAWELLLQLGKFLDKTLKTQSPYCLQVMKSITIVTVCMKYNHFFQALSTLSTPAYIHIYIYIYNYVFVFRYINGCVMSHDLTHLKSGLHNSDVRSTVVECTAD